MELRQVNAPDSNSRDFWVPLALYPQQNPYFILDDLSQSRYTLIKLILVLQGEYYYN